MTSRISMEKKNLKNSNLHEKRIGLYVLMGSIIYILTLKNRNEKGFLDTSCTWLLVLFRAGPLGGIILMIPYMISNLKLQINNFCETLKLYHIRYNKQELITIAKELFPNLDKQLLMIEVLKNYIIKGLLCYIISESLNEISIHYIKDSNFLLLFIPYFSSMIRSLGTIMYCVGLLKDTSKTSNVENFIIIMISSMITILYYFLTKYILKYLILNGDIILVQGLMGKILDYKTFKLFIYTELILQNILFSITILRKKNNRYASNASKISSIIGSLFKTTSIILRCFHIDNTKLPYFIPYLEIGPLIWGSFILSHSIAFYIRYEGIEYFQKTNLTSIEKKTQ